MADLRSTHILDPKGVSNDHDVRKAIGLDIEALHCGDDFTLRFKTGTLVLADVMHNCCETRTITCDDDLPSFVGARLLGIEVLEGDGKHDGYHDVHETMFVRIHTNKGDIVVCTHNHHNGYYGGFDLQATWSDAI